MVTRIVDACARAQALRCHSRCLVLVVVAFIVIVVVTVVGNRIYTQHARFNKTGTANCMCICSQFRHVEYGKQYDYNVEKKTTKKRR